MEDLPYHLLDYCYYQQRPNTPLLQCYGSPSLERRAVALGTSSPSAISLLQPAPVSLLQLQHVIFLLLVPCALFSISQLLPSSFALRLPLNAVSWLPGPLSQVSLFQFFVSLPLAPFRVEYDVLLLQQQYVSSLLLFLSFFALQLPALTFLPADDPPQPSGALALRFFSRVLHELCGVGVSSPYLISLHHPW